MSEKVFNFAVLIDSDNISPKYIQHILNEVSDSGIATYKRIYGDWSGDGSKAWKEVLLNYAITPVQQYSYVKRKNATDIAMVIDAMDILYTGNVDGFCIVASDSDYTRLAVRLREAGKFVLGIGEEKTPQALRNACNSFRLVEVITGTDTELENNLGRERKAAALEDITKNIVKIIDENNNKGKTTHIGEIGSKLQNKYPDFDVRNYGFSKLSTFLEDGVSEVELIKKGKDNTVQLISNELTKQKIEAFILKYVKENGGHIDNLSILSRALKEWNKDFNMEDYGYRKFSSFLNSFKNLKVEENVVDLI